MRILRNTTIGAVKKKKKKKNGSVVLSSSHCAAESGPKQLTFGACSAEQMHIIHLNGSDIGVDGIIFDCSNLTLDTGRDMAAIKSISSHAENVRLEHNRFMNINKSSQGFYATIMSGCSNCIVRGNVVDQSGGDALNFNAGEYIITANTVTDTGDGCIAMNNNAFGMVTENILRRCNLGIGAGPAGSVQSTDASTPFTISNNLIEDSDYGILLGWFGYKGRLGPVNSIVSNNVIRRCRSAAIQNNGGPGAFDGAWVVSENQITHSGFPSVQPPHTTGKGPGHGIYAVSLRDVQIRGNVILHGLGDGITAEGLHFLVTNNIVSTEASASNTSTGIVVSDSVDMTVSGNNIRGFSRGIVVTDKERIYVKGK
jgi:hypothetical protein